MSSRIVRESETAGFPAISWSSWNTEVVDEGAAPPPMEVEQRREPRPAEDLQKQLQLHAEASWKQGYQEGESAARAACRREVEEAARQMALAVQNAAREKARLRQEAERDVVLVALAIARKILRREVRIDPGAALGLVKAAMEAVGARELQAVRTTPSLAPALGAGLAALGAGEGVKVVADASLEPGGLVVETTRGEVDASMETQLEEISRGLLDAVSGAGGRP